MVSLSRTYVPALGSLIAMFIAAAAPLLALVLPVLAALELLFVDLLPVVAAELEGEFPPQAASANTRMSNEANRNQCAGWRAERKAILTMIFPPYATWATIF